MQAYLVKCGHVCTWVGVSDRGFVDAEDVEDQSDDQAGTVLALSAVHQQRVARRVAHEPQGLGHARLAPLADGDVHAEQAAWVDPVPHNDAHSPRLLTKQVQHHRRQSHPPRRTVH
jgi:hypothetical protein